MEKIFNKNIFLKVITLLLCFYLAIVPFFQPKKVQASLLIASASVVAGVITAMVAAGYVHYTSLTPEQMNEMNEKATANLKEAYPNATDYDNQVNIIYNLEKDLLAGKDIDWSKYSGKALYAVLKGVVDVVWPTIPENESQGRTLLGTYGDNRLYVTLNPETTEGMFPTIKIPYFPLTGWYFDNDDSIKNCFVRNVMAQDGKRYAGFYVDIVGSSNYRINQPGKFGFSFATPPYPNWSVGLDKDFILTKFLGLAICDQTSIYRPDFKNKLPNKVKLPTRLPQTVINNITNYIDGSTENLIVNPTPDELPQLPEGYNPNTDDLPDLPGYQDVVPDQEPTTDPEPTPTSTPTPPDPTPTPEGDYNGDRWVNPIGDFMDGLLKFMKAAFVPTLSLNLDALNSMPDNLSEKFPFSLPGDLIRLFGIFQAEPVPLAFDWEVDFTSVGAGKIPIKGDLSMFDEYAPLFRNLAFIAFIIGLAWKTFGMFFGGGDE
ncbi:hypothetical protein [Eubacterium limosum]|uniref:hypothetical protein n=1 Tax=Eubacterium limosum TaxID=1736 RepID=UPI0022E7AC6F|nr:hypothetical protein [Eubacterium limosum]